MIKFVIEFMDDTVESVEDFGITVYNGLIKPLIVVLIEMFIVLSYPLWIVPYKIFRKTDKNHKSAEAYASKGEEEC